MSFLVISSSLNPDSRSRLLAREAHRLLSVEHKAGWLDLRTTKLPQCDGVQCYKKPSVVKVTEQIAAASCILFAVPIYNFDSGSAAKNLIELTDKAWSEKTVGFLCAAGGRSSYMSIMSMANSLMLDFRSLIIPRFVYADQSAFADGKIADAAVLERIKELVDAAVLLDGAFLKAGGKK
jgi:FMN reductase